MKIVSAVSRLYEERQTDIYVNANVRILDNFVVTALGTATYPELYGMPLQKPTGSKTSVFRLVSSGCLRLRNGQYFRHTETNNSERTKDRTLLFEEKVVSSGADSPGKTPNTGRADDETPYNQRRNQKCCKSNKKRSTKTAWGEVFYCNLYRRYID